MRTKNLVRAFAVVMFALSAVGCARSEDLAAQQKHEPPAPCPWCCTRCTTNGLRPAELEAASGFVSASVAVQQKQPVPAPCPWCCIGCTTNGLEPAALEAAHGLLSAEEAR